MNNARKFVITRAPSRLGVPSFVDNRVTLLSAHTMDEIKKEGEKIIRRRVASLCPRPLTSGYQLLSMDHRWELQVLELAIVKLKRKYCNFQPHHNACIAALFSCS